MAGIHYGVNWTCCQYGRVISHSGFYPTQASAQTKDLHGGDKLSFPTEPETNTKLGFQLLALGKWNISLFWQWIAIVKRGEKGQKLLEVKFAYQCHAVLGTVWITWMTIHSYSSKQCGFRDLAFFSGYIRKWIYLAALMPKSYETCSSFVDQKKGWKLFMLWTLLILRLNCTLTALHVSLLVGAVVSLWCCDGSSFIC